jgi:protein TonB
MPIAKLLLVLSIALLLTSCNKPAAPASQPAAANASAQPAVDPNAPIPPRLKSGVHAKFPDTLWDKPGTVAVSAVVGPDGKVGETKIVSSPHPELNQLAIDAVKQWQFDPATQAGKPIPFTIAVNVNFQRPAPNQPAAAQAPPAKPSK